MKAIGFRFNSPEVPTNPEKHYTLLVLENGVLVKHWGGVGVMQGKRVNLRGNVKAERLDTVTPESILATVKTAFNKKTAQFPNVTYDFEGVDIPEVTDETSFFEIADLGRTISDTWMNTIRDTRPDEFNVPVSTVGTV